MVVVLMTILWSPELWQQNSKVINGSIFKTRFKTCGLNGSGKRCQRSEKQAMDVKIIMLYLCEHFQRWKLEVKWKSVRKHVFSCRLSAKVGIEIYFSEVSVRVQDLNLREGFIFPKLYIDSKIFKGFLLFFASRGWNNKCRPIPESHILVAWKCERHCLAIVLYERTLQMIVTPNGFSINWSNASLIWCRIYWSVI